MLRRNLSVIATTVASQGATRFRHGRGAEEQAEIDRETKLRQEFARKQRDQLTQGRSFFARFAPPMPPGATPGQAQVPAGFGGFMYSFFLYSLAFYLLVLTWEMRKPQSVAMAFQGMDQIGVPVEVTVCYFALRTLLSSSKQREVQTEFESYRLVNPQHNLYHFVMLRYPTLFSGRTTSQIDFIAAMMAAHISTPNAKWTRALRVSRFSDDQARIDTVMENLRRDYPTTNRGPGMYGATQ